MNNNRFLLKVEGFEYVYVVNKYPFIWCVEIDEFFYLNEIKSGMVSVQGNKYSYRQNVLNLHINRFKKALQKFKKLEALYE